MELKVVTMLLLPFLSFLLYVYLFSRRNRYSNQLLPGSLGLPFIGQTFGLLKALKDDKFEEWFQKRIAKHGPIWKANLLGYPTVVLHGTNANKFCTLLTATYLLTNNHDQSPGSLILDDDSSTMISDEEIIDTVIVVMIAGYDITSILLTFTGIWSWAKDVSWYGASKYGNFNHDSSLGDIVTWELLSKDESFKRIPFPEFDQGLLLTPEELCCMMACNDDIRNISVIGHVGHFMVLMEHRLLFNTNSSFYMYFEMLMLPPKKVVLYRAQHDRLHICYGCYRCKPSYNKVPQPRSGARRRPVAFCRKTQALAQVPEALKVISYESNLTPEELCCMMACNDDIRNISVIGHVGHFMVLMEHRLLFNTNSSFYMYFEMLMLSPKKVVLYRAQHDRLHICYGCYRCKPSYNKVPQNTGFLFNINSSFYMYFEMLMLPPKKVVLYRAQHDLLQICYGCHRCKPSYNKAPQAAKIVGEIRAFKGLEEKIPNISEFEDKP
ncbi:cytochrome P450 [Artemisia annua]|uniref:Cytochrome P450 n=1 Tax=Artemisia annua TaxID=35608 RepID=A0A2U1PPN2_ARTAN|nr:cytochrome P450 [Artemisia annua]